MATIKKQYPFDVIESKWHHIWEENKTFHAWNPGEKKIPHHPFWKRHNVKTDTLPPKYYILDMFPYPSGAGLHVGHPEGYTATDILARYYRAKGFNVLHPMGWDAFGLPAEQYAVKTGQHPRITTETNINTFRKQIKALGFSYDWDREVNTTDPQYFKWTQWIFLKIYNSWFNPETNKAEPISTLTYPPELQSEEQKRIYRDNKRLAYVAEAPVNWCPALGTVLSNEEVIDGKSEVGGFPVIRKPMRQWMLRITAYADRLLKDLDLLEWSHSLKEMQTNWIGRSEGAEVTFIADTERKEKIIIFTTRADTLFGATYMVLAPEHKLIDQITPSTWPEGTPDEWKGNTDSGITTPPQTPKEAIEAYRSYAAGKSDLERTELSKIKTGVFTGAYAINPINNEEVPIYVADYVLLSYGSGAVMAVPSHDQRDYEFAKQHNLKFKKVIENDLTDQAYVDDGPHINSGLANGKNIQQAKEIILNELKKLGYGKEKISYKLRDWLFSRQRYWGEPIPMIIMDDGSLHPLHENELPLVLPELDEYKPSGTGESPLVHAKQWLNVVIDGKHGLRETNTMPQWAGSCWYYIRYIDPHNDKEIGDKKLLDHWLPVDLYIGGAEHAVLHLLYARFWHKFLYDEGVVSCKEPFKKLFHQGMILGSNGEKMSKSRGNVVNPDELIETYGADALRLYEMFMGPLEASLPWSSQGLEGARRFLDRVYRLYVDDENACKFSLINSHELDYAYHFLVKKVSDDFEHLQFNTAISQMMIFINEAYKAKTLYIPYMEGFIKMLSCIAPHIGEEIWEKLGHNQVIAYENWPDYDEKMLIKNEVEIAIQVNGKLRASIKASIDASEKDIQDIALANENVKRHIDGKTIKKIIVIKNKIVNIVAI